MQLAEVVCVKALGTLNKPKALWLLKDLEALGCGSSGEELHLYKNECVTEWWS